MDPFLEATKGSVPYNPFKADIWALGVILMKFIYNTFPYERTGSSMFKYMTKQAWDRFWQRIEQESSVVASAEAKQLL